MSNDQFTTNTITKGDIAHGHYTIFNDYYSIPLSDELLANPLYLQTHPSQTMGA